jgi:hypothetical protein
MKQTKFYALIVSILIIVSCTNIREQKEYISVYIANHTGENILIYTGSYIIIFEVPSAVIPSGSEYSVLVEKGQRVTAYGEDTNREYGSRSFYTEMQWNIY